jgi:metallo-beta-lactamase class B
MKYLLLINILVAFCSHNVTAQKKGFDIKQLSKDFYVYTTYKDYGGKPFPSNSMFIVTSKGIAMIDTPWDTTQTKPLCDSIEERFNQKIVFCISTHFHSDRTAGLNVMEARGIKTWSSKQTWDSCTVRDEERARHYFNNDTSFHFGNHTLQTFYPGPGHTADNIVVWFAKEKILFGGCFIKSAEAPDLGFTGDASVKQWPQSIRNAAAAFGNAIFVIPGHQQWSDTTLFTHTLQLLGNK